MDPAPPVGRHVEVEGGPPADGLEVDLQERLGALHLGVLLGVVEPAQPDRDVHLGGEPIFAVPVALDAFLGAHQAGGGRLPGDRGVGRVGGPAGIPRVAPLVPDPADVGAHVAEDARPGLESA